METSVMPSQEKTDAVLRMQAFIGAHIREPITQFQLARAAGYSETYAARIFKELTGTSPFEYIRRLRLSHAAIALRARHTRVIDIALDYVFDSHEGFTRAFAKEFGFTPKEYAKNPRPIRFFMPPAIRDFTPQKLGKEGKDMSDTPSAIFVQIMDRPARKLILKRGKTAADYFEFCEEAGCDIWEKLCAVPGALYEPIGMWMPENLRPQGTSVYTQGVEIPLDWEGEIPEGFEMIQLPPCKMLIFQGPPYEEENFMEAIDELWKQTARYNPELYGYQWDEAVAPKIQLAPMGYRGYIEGRPVRPING